MKILILICCFVAALTIKNDVNAGDLAIIINPSNPLKNIEPVDLRKIFLYEKSFWENGDRIFLVIRESGSPEKEIVLKYIYQITEEELKRLWLSKLYKGEIPAPPQIANSNQSMKKFVARVPSAIGFIDSEEVDETIKTVQVNGKSPGELNYLLRMP